MEKLYSRSAPSPRYVELLSLYRVMHEDGQEEAGIPAEHMFAGRSLTPLAVAIKQVIDRFRPRTLLDYGAGKGVAYRTPITINGTTYDDLRAYWGVDEVTCYDPGYKPYSELPERRFDGVICTDVLEHIPEDDLPWILEEMFAFARLFVFGNIASYPARKHLPNGENAHCTVRPKGWWEALIGEVAVGFPRTRYVFAVHSIGAGANGRSPPGTEVIAG
jgi:hypothetical protein